MSSLPSPVPLEEAHELLAVLSSEEALEVERLLQCSPTASQELVPSLEARLRHCEQDIETLRNDQEIAVQMLAAAEKVRDKASEKIQHLRSAFEASKDEDYEDQLEDAELALTEKSKALATVRKEYDESVAATEAAITERTQISSKLSEARQQYILAVRHAVHSVAPDAADRITKHCDDSPLNGQDEKSPTVQTSVELVIRLDDSLEKSGYVVDDAGVVISSPGNLLDDSFTVIGMDGMLFTSSMRAVSGKHQVILRCTRLSLRQSLERIPKGLLEGKALRLLQVRIAPDSGGFGIDLTDYNGVAQILSNGAAACSDLQVGDVIISVDGVDTSTKALIEVLHRGHAAYAFSVLRPSVRTTGDSLQEELELPVEQQPSSEEDTAVLRLSMAQSLNQLQQQTSELASSLASAVQISRVEATAGSAITVGWEANSNNVSYELEWKQTPDGEWTSTTASRSLTVCVVTKGNLVNDRGYSFRVRGRSANGTWSAFSQPSAPVRPDGEPVSDSTALSPVVASQNVTTLVPASVAEGEKRMSMDYLQRAMFQQRTALEVEHNAGIAVMHSHFHSQLKVVQLEAAEWKARYLEGQHERNEAVASASAEARVEALAKLGTDGTAVEESNRTLEQACAKKEAAEEREQLAKSQFESARAELERCKLRFLQEKDGYRAQFEKDMQGRLNAAMRNTAADIKEKIKAEDEEGSQRIEIDVATALKEFEADSEERLRLAMRKKEDEHAAKLQEMNSLAAAGARSKIADSRSSRDGRLQAAVSAALAEVNQKHATKIAEASKRAKVLATEQASQKLMAERFALEQQLIRVNRALDQSLAQEHEQQAKINAQIAEAREQASQQLRQVEQQAGTEAQESGEQLLKQAGESYSRAIREAVLEREQELMREDSRLLRELAERGLKELGAQASIQIKHSGDEFEEVVLSKTKPTTLMLEHRNQRLLEAVDAPTEVGCHPMAESEEMSEGEHSDEPDPQQPPRSFGRGRKERSDESNDATSRRYQKGDRQRRKRRERSARKAEIRLAERHTVEREVLRARSQAKSAVMLDPSDVASSVLYVADEDELKSLRERQLAEAIALGASLSYQQRLKDHAVLDFRSPLPSLLDHTLPEEAEDGGIEEELAAKYPALKKALERVRDVESQYNVLLEPRRQLQAALEREKEEHQRTTSKLLSLLHRRSGKDENIDEKDIPQADVRNGTCNDAGHHVPASSARASEAELNDVRVSLELLELHGRQSEAMQAMLREFAPDSVSGDIEVVMKQLMHELEEAKGSRESCSKRLAAILTSKKIGEKELRDLRELTAFMREEQGKTQAREARIDWLYAEARRVRLMRLHDARARLEGLREEALRKSQPSLELIYPPVAAPSNESSISVDWVPPCADVAAYHLQWREVGGGEWSDSPASAQIRVPMCTKSALRPDTEYEFRVRASDSSGMWGRFSKPSEPVSPSADLGGAPSRPRVREMSKARIEARWSDGDHRAAEKYEIQWREIDAGSWDACEKAIISNTYYRTPSLHMGSAYIFRVRACTDSYSGSRWTTFSPSSPPIRPLQRDGEACGVLAPLTERISWAQRGPGPTEHSRIKTEEIVPQRQLGGESEVSSRCGTATEIEVQVRAAAAAFASGTKEQAKAASEVRALNAMKQKATKIHEIALQHKTLQKDDHRRQLEGLQKLQDQLLSNQAQVESSSGTLGKLCEPPPSTVSATSASVTRDANYYVDTLD